MASDNSAEITFDADLSGLTDALQEAAAGVGDFGDRSDAVFARLTDSLQRASALAPGLSQSLSSIRAPALTVDDSALETQIDQAGQRAQAAADRVNEAVIEGSAKAADAQIKTQQQVVTEQQELGQISGADALQQLEALAGQEHDVNLKRITDMRAVYESQGNGAGVARMDADALAEQQRYTQQIDQLQTAAALKAKAQWNDTATSISRAFGTSVQGIVLGTQTVQQAMSKLGQNIVAEFIDGTIQKMVKQWIAGNATIQDATATLQGFLGISDAATAESSVTSAQAAASANIAAYASEGAAAAIASTAAIPLVGPELAPAAGTAIYADIMSFGLPSAAGGWMVPSDQLAMVHENERILPARYSAGLDAMVGNAATGQGQGGHTFNNSFHINAADGVTARQMPGMIQSHIERSVRNGSFGRMSRT